MNQNELLFLAGVLAFAACSFVLCLFRPRLGLLLSPVFSLSIAVWTIGLEPGSADFTVGASVILTVLSQIFSLGAAAVAKYPEGRPTWPRSVARVVFAVLGSLVVMAATIGLLGPVGFLAVLFAIAAFINYLLISRDARTVHLFSTLSAAMRQGLPLTTALEIESGWQSGSLRYTLARVNLWLTQGLGLTQALRKGYPACPGFALGQLAAGEQMRQLPQAAEQVVEQLQRRGREMGEIHPVNPVYPMVVLLWLCLTLGGVTVFIFPKLKDILAGTGAPMPTVTRWVFESAPAVIGVMVPALFLIAIVWVYVLFRPRNPDRPKLLSVLGDHVKWHLPAWGWFERNYAMLQTVTCLRMGLRSGEPVDRAIGQAARLDINECYRRRLRRWLRRVQAGEGLAASAAASGAGAGLAWAFDQEANPGQTPAVLEMLESAYRSAYSYKAHIARSVFWPVVIVAMATLVGLVAVGVFQMFAAMVSHIEALT